jgi:two-component system, NarL family, nitrate/nitrite response regulator NarL
MPSPEPAPVGGIRILLADDHAMFRQALRRLLEDHGDVIVVGEAGDGAEAVAMTHQLTPDVLLLDVAMPGLSGLDVARQLHDARCPTRVIVVSAAVARAEVPRILKLGVRGIVAKESAIELLLKAIRAVHAGEYWVGREVVGDLVQAMGRRESRAGGKRPFGLTPRELELVRLVADGLSNKDIARRCSLREDTVKHHLSSIFDKTGVSTRLELALFALQNSLVEQ